MTFKEVYDEHFRFVWRSLRRLGVRESDVPDAVQDVFLVVHRRLAEFEGRSKVTTWLFGICFRVARDRRKLDQGLTLVRDLFESTGAKEVIQCQQGFGLHLMGGCVMGTDPAASVVNPDFQLHGCPDLFAADSSIFPSAPGINPSFTIMALSHRAAQAMLKR